MTGFTVIVDIEYRRGRRTAELRHNVPWYWLARLLAWSYVYGTIVMPLAGADVLDVYIKQQEPAR